MVGINWIKCFNEIKDGEIILIHYSIYDPFYLTLIHQHKTRVIRGIVFSNYNGKRVDIHLEQNIYSKREQNNIEYIKFIESTMIHKLQEAVDNYALYGKI